MTERKEKIEKHGGHKKKKKKKKKRTDTENL